jgi:hypothetical protein
MPGDGALFVMLEDRVACPFTALVVGEEVDVRGFDWAGASQEIVALCRRKGHTYRVSVTALQWAGRRPAGTEWLDAYRAWLKGTNGTYSPGHHGHEPRMCSARRRGQCCSTGFRDSRQ